MERSDTSADESVSELRRKRGDRPASGSRRFPDSASGPASRAVERQVSATGATVLPPDPQSHRVASSKPPRSSTAEVICWASTRSASSLPAMP